MSYNPKINSNITITRNKTVTIRYEVEIMRKGLAIVRYKVTITLFISISIFNLRWIQAFIAALIIAYL